MTVTFLEIESGPRILEEMLLISVLDLLVTLGGCRMCSKNVREEREVKEFISRYMMIIRQ